MADPAISPDNAAQAEHWNSPATRWWSERYDLIDRQMAELTQDALAIAAPRPGERVLDIGCGSGTTVLALAERVGAGGRVLGIDVAAPSVARARERIQASGVRNAEVIHADAATHRFDPAQFDLLFSRFGVMFFGDPAAAFANLHRAMKPGARATLIAWRRQEENPWVTAPREALRHLLPPNPPVPPGIPGEFAWAEAARVEAILHGGGFHDVTLTPRDPPIRLAAPGEEEAAADRALTIGPLANAVTEMNAEQRQAVRDALRDFLARHNGPEGVVFPGAIWVVQARA